MVGLVVYVDVLTVINLFVNYALLLCSSLIMKMRISNVKLLLGALVGSLYGLAIFLPQAAWYLELFMRVGSGALIVLISFGYKNMRRFMRCFFTFFAVTAAFGGIMLALWLTVAPTGMLYNNGAVYFDIDISVLAVSTVICFTLVSVVSKIIGRKAPANSVYNLNLTAGGKRISGVALCDTGNSLCESFSGYPVVIGEYDTLTSVLPQSIINYYENPTGAANAENLRVVVYKTVAYVGILPAFRPDSIELSSIDKKIKTDEVYIAVTRNRLGGGEFDFILNPKLFDGEKNYEDNKENKRIAAEAQGGRNGALCKRSRNASRSSVKAGGAENNRGNSGRKRQRKGKADSSQPEARGVHSQKV